MIDQTPIKAIEFNVKREVLGPAGNLVLSQYEMGGGEQIIATVIGGWVPTQTDDGLRVEIVENAPLDNGDTLSDGHVYTAHRLHVDGKVYRILSLEERGVVPPIGQPRLWTVKAVELRPQL